MSETGFGPGGYAYTMAAAPAAPVLTEDTATTVKIAVCADDNPDYTEYALYNETDGEYIDGSGGGTADPVWRTRDSWGTVTASGLTPETTYSFRVKARNREGVETEFGPAAQCATYGLGVCELPAVLEVVKASSTISPPGFMSCLETGIRIAGKSLNDFGFHADRITGLDMPRVVPDEELIPGSHSWHIRDEYFAPKRIVLEGNVHGTSPEDLRLRLAYLKSFLATFDGNPWRSTAPVKLERTDLPDRHWMVYYDSIETVEMPGKRDLSSSARIRIGMKSPEPYALSNEVVRVVFTPAAGGFMTIDLGNAPSDAVYVVEGASASPSFTVGDMVFHCDFSRGLAFTDVENAEGAGSFSPPENEAPSYRTTETGTGLLVAGSDTVSFAAPGNAADGSWVVVLTTEWKSSDRTDDAVVLEHGADADNYLRLFWDGSGRRWVFRKRAGGNDREVATPEQSFTAGTRLVLGVTYDGTNAGGMKIYVDGVQEGVNVDFEALSAVPGTLRLHAGDGTGQPDVVFDMVAGWSRMLSSDEMLKIASDPGAVANRNRTVSYAGTLDDGDTLTLDSRLKTAVLFDVSEGTRSNALDPLAGPIPVLTPGRRRAATDHTQTVVYTKAAAARMEVRYRRRFL